MGTLLLLLAFKGLVWSVSLGSFRGGPTFPALFVGAAAGLLASHLPGFAETGAIGVGMGAGIVSVLRLPLAAAVLSTLLVSQGGAGAGPLIIVGVVVAYMASVALDRAFGDAPHSQGTLRMSQVLIFACTAAFNPTLLTATTVMLLLPSPKRLLLGYLLGAYVDQHLPGDGDRLWARGIGRGQHDRKHTQPGRRHRARADPHRRLPRPAQ